jgi:hypothetical protein
LIKRSLNDPVVAWEEEVFRITTKEFERCVEQVFIRLYSLDGDDAFGTSRDAVIGRWLVPVQEQMRMGSNQDGAICSSFDQEIAERLC